MGIFLDPAVKPREDGFVAWEDGFVAWEDGFVAWEEGFVEWFDGFVAQFDGDFIPSFVFPRLDRGIQNKNFI